jgi:hypothetical protein
MRLLLLSAVLLCACASAQEREERREIERLQRELADARFWVEKYVELEPEHLAAPGARKFLTRMNSTRIEDLGIEDLRKELKAAKYWLDEFRTSCLFPLPMPNSRAGKVLEVQDSQVRISIGSADGVRVGDTFQLRRGAKYVGQMFVTKISKNTSIGEFDSGFVGPGAPPRPGDVAEHRGW